MPFTDFISGIENLDTKNGDFIQDYGDNQNASDIIYSGIGNFFANPLVGVGIYGQINSTFGLVVRERSIRYQLKEDGFTIVYYKNMLDANGNQYQDIRAKK